MQYFQRVWTSISVDTGLESEGTQKLFHIPVEEMFKEQPTSTTCKTEDHKKTGKLKIQK